MKKKFIFILMLISLISHIHAMEKVSAVGVIEDSFFKLTNAVVSIRTIIPHADHYMAVVDASTEFDSKTTSIQPFFFKTWVHDDSGRVSFEKLLVTVMCGNKVVEKSQQLDTKFPYLFLKDSDEHGDVLSPGKTITVYKVSEYERADKSIFRVKGKALYDLSMKEERVVGPQLSVCGKEWSIISQWKKKTRHLRTVYNSEEVYQIVTKTVLNMVGNDIKPITEEVSRILSRKELRLSHIDPEVPECGSLGRELPGGYLIVG